jgi:hypothetical protein
VRWIQAVKMKVDGTHYRTIFLHEEDHTVVRIIDQRKLPHVFEIEDLSTWEEMAVSAEKHDKCCIPALLLLGFARRCIGKSTLIAATGAYRLPSRTCMCAAQG